MLAGDASAPVTGHVTVSVGLATWPIDGRNATDLLGEADRRLFAAKNAGRNRVVGPPVHIDPAVSTARG